MWNIIINNDGTTMPVGMLEECRGNAAYGNARRKLTKWMKFLHGYFGVGEERTFQYPQNFSFFDCYLHINVS